jgi:pantoate--beta-alanine ligase
MNVFETTQQTTNAISQLRLNGNKVGFVPTMGALHNGHLQLVKQSINENDVTVVSIFVNPIQFNNPEDLKKYPRTLNEDLNKLQNVGCDIVFTPTEQEMYPDGKPNEIIYDFGQLERVMEGAFRPGHFNGVAIVVKRLFEIVQPHNAYFGEKDYQQLKIIQALVKKEQLDVNIVPCPIVREDNGLAMSSRNERLSAEERKNAAIIYATLSEIKRNYAEKSPKEWTDWFTQQINAVSPFTVEYLTFADANTLQPVNNWSEASKIRAFTSVYCNTVRLIDNIEIK